jgi:heme iron utilization protein
VDREALRFGPDASPLALAEADIVAHMNQDHAEAVGLYAGHLLGLAGAGWRMTGIDPEGIDLRRDGEVARLDFDAPVLTPAAARRTLVALAEAARQGQGG